MNNYTFVDGIKLVICGNCNNYLLNFNFDMKDGILIGFVICLKCRGRGPVINMDKLCYRWLFLKNPSWKYQAADNWNVWVPGLNDLKEMIERRKKPYENISSV